MWSPQWIPYAELTAKHSIVWHNRGNEDWLRSSSIACTIAIWFRHSASWISFFCFSFNDILTKDMVRVCWGPKKHSTCTKLINQVLISWLNPGSSAQTTWPLRPGYMVHHVNAILELSSHVFQKPVLLASFQASFRESFNWALTSGKYCRH